VVGGLILGPWLFWIGVAFTLFCLYFFRDPKRVPPQERDLVIAPADGKVVLVGPAVPPAELEMGEAPRWRVAIFLSVLDVHVNYAPVQGRISRIAYRHGTFIDASMEKASTENERNALRFDLPDGRQLACVQIAGLVARRIVCNVREGDQLQAGDRFGIIRFGSRTDVYSARGREAQGAGRPDHDRRRDRAGGPRARPWRRDDQAEPPRQAAPPRPAPAAALPRAVLQPADPQPDDDDRPVLRPGRHPLRHRGAVPAGGLLHRGRRRHRRAGRAHRAAAQGHLALRRGVRQPQRLPLLRRGAGADSLPLDAAACGAAGLHPLRDVRGLQLAAPRAFQRRSIAEPGVVPPPKPAYAYNFFQGVPAPAGAGLALFPLFASLAFEEWEWDGFAHALRFPLFSAVVLFVVGGLMVSTLPSWSFKNFKVPAQMVLPLLLGTGAFIAFLVTEPWAALALGGALYMGMLVLSARSYQRLKAEAEAMIVEEPPASSVSEG
jgi:phosphatidylserine decarboxylase